MIYFGLGVLVLVIGLWLLRGFAEADPARLARGAARLGIVVGATVAVLVLIVLLATGRLGLVLAELGGIVPLAIRGWMLWRRRQSASGPPPGRSSQVETDYIRMWLDHDSGTMSGTVRRGPFQGRRLDELGRADLVALWRECRAEDEQAANLLEAYLDRLTPGWREAAQDHTTGASPSTAADAMSREEAYAILGLAPGAGEVEIRDAHRRLMMKLHPDQGGSTYLAAKLNRAREVLLEG
jgi:DnaJ-like protein